MNREELLSFLRDKGFSNQVVEAFSKVKRESFAPERLSTYAYEDIPIPVGDGSTISQPSTMAFILDLLELSPGMKVLEIGSGSGYALALISGIIRDGKVFGIELQKDIAIKSKRNLSQYNNISVLILDGSKGIPDQAPFDRILISATSPNRDIINSLLPQLKENGIIIAPVETSLIKIKKLPEGKTEENEFHGFIFVPLISDKDEKK